MADLISISFYSSIFSSVAHVILSMTDNFKARTRFLEWEESGCLYQEIPFFEGS